LVADAYESESGLAELSCSCQFFVHKHLFCAHVFAVLNSLQCKNISKFKQFERWLKGKQWENYTCKNGQPMVCPTGISTAKRQAKKNPVEGQGPAILERSATEGMRMQPILRLSGGLGSCILNNERGSRESSADSRVSCS